MDKPMDEDYLVKRNNKVIKVKQTKLPQCLSNKSFLWLLLGPPRSGKSTYIESLLTAEMDKRKKRQSYEGLFEDIIFFTPQIKDFENIELESLPNVFDTLSIANLTKAIEIATKIYNSGGQTCIVFDDMGSTFRSGKNLQTLLEDTCFNHRHMGLSIFFSAQTFKSLSPGMRKSARLITTFAIDSMEEREIIFKDLPIKKHDQDALYEYVFDNPEDEGKVDSMGRPAKFNLYIDKSKTRNSKIVFYKNFDLIKIT